MPTNLPAELADLARLTVDQLRCRYAELFEETTQNRHRTWLVKRLAWRLQALAEGDLSERARRRAEELARDADLRMMPPRETKPVRNIVTKEPQHASPDHRLPKPGTLLIRRYKGETIQVEVLTNGFLYLGQRYTSLSAVAKAITGSHCNGYLFFRLNGGQR